LQVAKHQVQGTVKVLAREESPDLELFVSYPTILREQQDAFCDFDGTLHQVCALWSSCGQTKSNYR
jgi:hypothetical protein